MKRRMFTVTVCLVVFSFSLVLAEAQAPTAVPAKARAILENMVGTWNVQGDPDEDGVSLRGQSTLVWSPGQHYLLMNSRYKIGDIDGYDNAIVGWDGLSEDGIIIFRKAPIGLHETYRFKMVSQTVNEGVMDAVGMGGTQKGKVRMVEQGDDKSVWYFTDQTAQGQPLPDWKVVYTRVKTTGDEQELVRLYQRMTRDVKERNLAAMDHQMADGYVETHGDGTALTKSQILDAFRSDSVPLTDLAMDKLKVRIYGDMAVVRGRAMWSVRDGSSYQSPFTDTWFKQDGRWQIVASHNSEEVPQGASGDEQAGTSKLSPEMKKLEVFVGDWAYEGEQMEPPVAGLPYGGAGKFSGKSTVRFVLDGAFQEGRFRDAAPGTASGIGLTGYSSQEKCYVRHGYVDDGSQSISTATLDGHIWKIDSVTTTSKGDKVPVRYIEEYASDWSSYTGTVEASPDNGKTWKLWWKERGKKVK